MHAFHFGTSRTRLFGVYHAPESSRSAPAGVVICPPSGHEYIRAHRALRNLAVHLSAAGLHVLRFDYFGTGDSSGAGEEASASQWVADAGAAIDELKDMSELARVSVVGVRLGAAIAALACERRKDIDALILWDPVVAGAEYVAEMLDLQSRWLKTRPWVKVPREWPDSSELIGFPLPPTLRAEMEAVDLLRVERWPARQMSIVTSRNVDASALERHIDGAANRDRSLRVERVGSDCDWTRAAAVHLTLLAPEMIGVVARQLAPEIPA